MEFHILCTMHIWNACICTSTMTETGTTILPGTNGMEPWERA